MANPNQPGQKLKFRIVDFSGEDPEYPATELLAQSPQSRGWQSPRFCDWPQYITLQFVSPVNLKQLQFLSHQCKIASKIELYTANPDLKSALPTLDLKFKKLGYLSLDPNERSGFQSRELKTVYVDVPCMYLKIVFQKCHVNKYNLFNQVGLIAIGAFGDPLSKDKENNPDPRQHKYDKLEYETQFDQQTIQRLKDLEDAKNKAVKDENFDEAKRLKEAIDRLKHIGAQLQHLEERKLMAIQNEDYDGAKVIKMEIDRLRDAVAPTNLLRRGQSYESEDKPIQPRRKQPSVPFEIPEDQNEYDKPLKSFDKKQSFTEEDEEYKYNDQEPDLPINNKKNTGRQVYKNIQMDDDERPLPTLANKEKNGNDPNMYEGDNNATEAEPLSSENKKLAEPLIPVIGEDLASRIFSRTWNNREEGVKTIENEVKLDSKSRLINFKDPGAAFVALMGVVNYTINDKIVQVAQKSLTLLQTVLTKEPSNIGSRNEINSYIETITTGLLDKIGDNNVRVREQAEQAFMSMVRSKAVTCNYCVASLIKAIPNTTSIKGHKTNNSTRHILGRLGLLRAIIQEFKVNNNNVPYNPVVSYTVDKLENSNPEIRQAAFNILVDIYSLVGEKLRNDLSGIRPQHMEMLQKEFDQISGGGGGQDHGNYNNYKEPIITTNINPQGGKKGGAGGAGGGGGGASKANAGGTSKGGAMSNKGPQSGEAGQPVQGVVCEFCGRHDRSLNDPGKMDIHLWKECPMLTTCSNCAQVVEISGMNHHLLEECENRKLMRKCPRCKEAIPMDEFKQHTDEMSCPPLLPLDQANRCPLCHQDIPAGENGWKKHLLYEGCPNNDRTV